MQEADRTLLFVPVEAGGQIWTSIATGMGVNTAMVAALLLISFTAPTVLRTSSEHVELVAPIKDEQPIRRYTPPRVRIIAPSQARLREIAPVSAPKVQVPIEMKHDFAKVETPVPKLAPQPVVTGKFDAPAPSTSPRLERQVKTEMFSGSSAQPTLQARASAVQTGGFGDPNGVTPAANGSRTSKLATTGSFDLPGGTGQGNGTGGHRGAQGRVATAGFGNGIASDGGRGTATQGRVQLAAFGNNVAPVAEAPKRKIAEAPTNTPLSIQSKPQPVYTAEARSARIEGEVLVEALFTADGHVRVVRVVKPLGHGLDEAAIRAAEGIRFSPAIRDGHAVDSKTTLHIKFQLS